jgi:hypothetical protein
MLLLYVGCDTGGSCRRAVFRSARTDAAVSEGAATAPLLVRRDTDFRFDWTLSGFRARPATEK